MDGIAGHGKHVFKAFPFVRRELPEDVPGHPARSVCGSDSHFQTGKTITTQMLDDRLDPVVPSCRALFPETQMPERQRDIIVSDEDIADVPFMKGDELPHRASAQVHESLRFHQDRPVGELREVRLPLRLCFENSPFLRRDSVEQHKADVVPGILVLPAGISEADDQGNCHKGYGFFIHARFPIKQKRPERMAPDVLETE